MLAYFLDALSPFIFQFRPGFGPRWYGLAYVLAFVVAFALYRRLVERGYSQLPLEKVDGFITGVALCGVMLGGRIGHFVFYAPGDFARDPLSFFRVWEGGMSSHGGMLGIIVFTFFYARAEKISWPGLGDNLVVVAPLGLLFGRIANFINGELFGRIANVSWAVQFPRELADPPVDASLWPRGELPFPQWVDSVLEKCNAADPRAQTVGDVIELARTSEPVRAVLRGTLHPRHPSQLYEALLEGALLFCSLYFLRTKTRQPRGALTGAFFILYALARIVCECFREPGDPLIGIFTRGQFLSLFLIAIGAAFVIWGLRARQFERVDLPTK